MLQRVTANVHEKPVTEAQQDSEENCNISSCLNVWPQSPVKGTKDTSAPDGSDRSAFLPAALWHWGPVRC